MNPSLSDLQQIFALSAQKNFSCAAFRLPNSTNIEVWASSRLTANQGPDYFLLAPFQEHAFPHCHTYPDWQWTHNNIDDLSQWPANPAQHFPLPEKILSKAEFTEQVQFIQNQIANSNLCKAIAYRVHQEPTQADLASVLLNACQRYHDAFCYVYFHPQSGWWFGATPELFLSQDSQGGQTISLAGTRLDKDAWTTKEIEEQAIVSDFIDTQLKSKGITATMEGPYNKQAGQLWHLETAFKWQGQRRWQDFANLLHPTPATGGFPRSEAFQEAMANRYGARAYYCGFVGPIKSQNVALYVNLRSGQWTPEQLYLYLGCGITESSIADDEYQETIAKASTLLSLLDE